MPFVKPKSTQLSGRCTRSDTNFDMPCTIATCINNINIFISVRELVRTKGLRFIFFV